jgi:hypothetical protein
MAGTVRVTGIGAYTELDPAPAVRVTSLGAYAELDPAPALRITGAGVYVEYGPPQHVRLTSLGAYVEIYPPIIADQFRIEGNFPPEGARPYGRYYRLILPESRGRTGVGDFAKAIGKASLEITFPALDQAGWAWWAALTGEELSHRVTSVVLWNDWKAGGPGWEEWTGGGIVHSPTYGALSGGVYYDVKIIISDMAKA